ncbi:ABC transporter ATP-binding protein [Thomasclavelia sp.]|uniref:ABC transporter ATP-binding protein n=1 Tax=Thomasclavelia sp. TaxID=3025757 RepID=UPI0025D23838|nr:ATP-binding cassette domain-containing protein [Thomasclavelia sp.]
MKLEIKNYTKEIKGNVILNNINLAFESGNVYGFYGRNGSGKTMLFRAVTTLIHPNQGDVLVDGKSIINNEFDLSQIGVLIEDPGYYPHLSGFENLMMLYTINNKKDNEFIHGVLKKMNLDHAANKKYKEYSLGMKQRLRVAQAFMENQKIIILDEPTNGIDEEGLKVVHKLIGEAKKEGKIILLASHSKDDLFALSDVVYKIDNGKIVGILEKKL